MLRAPPASFPRYRNVPGQRPGLGNYAWTVLDTAGWIPCYTPSMIAVWCNGGGVLTAAAVSWRGFDCRATKSANAVDRYDDDAADACRAE